VTQSGVDPLVDKSERIGVVGSPSATSALAVDILGTAVSKKLVGELALFRYLQDTQTNYALGQITEISLRNIWHEDPTMRSLIRQRGRVDAVSERQDTHQGELTISAVFSSDGGTYRPSSLGTVPATGTPIYLAEDELLDELLRPYRDQMFYLGHVYGSRPRLPLWFKHFDRGRDGAGEAYHLGVFGKTGSGKSVLAKMILLAYARYPAMGLLIIDPQGEFAKDVRGEHTGGFELPLREALNQLGKKHYVVGVRNLVLDRWELFAEILYESLFFEQLSMPKGENRRIASETLADQLRRKCKLATLHEPSSFDQAWALLGEDRIQKIFYRSASSQQRFALMHSQADKRAFFSDFWAPVAELFRTDRTGARTVEGMLYDLFSAAESQRPLIVVNLSSESQAEKGSSQLLWNETIQALVIRRLLQGIRGTAERSYQAGKSLNTLVLLDEAHRLAPRETPDNDALGRVRHELIDAARTTRKYGVGWFFISQTLSSLDREIINQLRIQFFGFGLSMGSEYRSLSELVGSRGKALALYQLFRDPHSSFDTASREYSFMTQGPVSPLSFSGTPLFFNAFNTPEEFLNANDLLP